MATKNSKKRYKNTQSSLKQKHTKPFMPYPTGSHSYQRIPHNESPFTKTLMLALVSLSLPTFHFPLSVFHSPTIFFNFPLTISFFFRIFAAGFGSPLGGPRGNRVQVPSSPAAVSSNELGRLRTKGHCGLNTPWEGREVEDSMTEVESRPLLGPDDRSGVKAPIGAGRPKWSQGPYWGTGTSQKTCQSHNQSLTALEERTF